nr:MAG TPA: hypothetical protein [Caudoviricetes sp.]
MFAQAPPLNHTYGFLVVEGFSIRDFPADYPIQFVFNIRTCSYFIAML